MRQVSFSQINMALRCPWKWGMFYARGLTAKEPPEYLSLGSAMHRALAKAYRLGTFDPDTWTKCDPPLSEENVVEMERLTKIYEPQIDLDLMEHEVLATEWPFRVPVKTRAGTRSNYLMVGWIDLITRNKESGAVWLWDHKTTKRTQTGHFLDFQLSVYAWGIWSLGLQPAGVRLNTIVRTETPKVQRTSWFKTSQELKAWGLECYNGCCMLPPLKTPQAELAKRICRDCEWDCQLRELCRLHSEGNLDAARAIVRDEWEPKKDGRAADRKTYNQRIPREWLHGNQKAE